MKIFIKKHTTLLFFFFSIGISYLLTIIIFRGLERGEFLFVGDEFLPFSLQETIRLSFLRNPRDFGLINGIPFFINFYERIYYFISYYFHLPIYNLQFFQYFLKLFISIFIPFVGLKKLKILYKLKTPQLSIVALSFWYSFNTYTLLNWNGGFPLTMLITYSFAPLSLYYFHKAVFEKRSLLSIIKAAVVLFIISFILYISAIFYMFLLIYTLLMLYFFPKKITTILKNLFLLILFFLPLYLPFFSIIFDYIKNAPSISTSLNNSTAGSLSGGILYQFLLWSQWPIYITWQPRNGFTFSTYLRSFPYIITPFLLYAFLLKNILMEKKNYLVVIFLSSFLIFLLFSKGPQEPFGFIYSFLIKNVAPFSIFRSPDNKFGFGVILTLALLFLLFLEKYKKKWIFVFFLSVSLIQALPIFTGIAVRGENIGTISWDRIIHVSKPYKEIASFLNSQKNDFTYVITYPPQAYDWFEIYKNKLHIGQDLLPKLIDFPFFYLTEEGQISPDIYKKLLHPNNDKATNLLKDLPIKYIIVRRDLRGKNVSKDELKQLNKAFTLIFKNELFNIYKNKNAIPIITGKNIEFQQITPVHYAIRFSHIKNDEILRFYQSYDKGWKLYIEKPTAFISCKKITYQLNIKGCRNEEYHLFDKNELSYPFRKAIFDNQHIKYNGYANEWTISPKALRNTLDKQSYIENSDGTIDFTITLYHISQSYFYSTFLLSGTILTLFLMFIFYREAKK